MSPASPITMPMMLLESLTRSQKPHQRHVVRQRIRRGDDLDELRIKDLNPLVYAVQVAGCFEVVVANDQARASFTQLLQLSGLGFLRRLDFHIGQVKPRRSRLGEHFHLRCQAS